MLSNAAPRVLIIGGGISGLALGQSLLRASIPFTIFERDSSPSFRAQGYRISHNTMGENGLKALLGNELWAKCRAMGTHEADRGLQLAGVRGDTVTGVIEPGGPFSPETLKMMMGGNKGGKGDKPGEGKPPGGGEPKKKATPFTSDRTVLRSMLGLGLENNISYGKRFAGFDTSSADDIVTARFEDGSTASGSILIGADGRRSRVTADLLSEQQQPPQVLLDLEIRTIYGKTPITPEFEKAFPEAWRRGISVFRDPIKRSTLILDPVIFNNKAEDLTDGKVKTPKDYMFWALAVPLESVGVTDQQLVEMDAEQTAALLNKLTEHWNSDLRKLFEHQDISQCDALRILSMPPDIPSRSSHPTVTIVGDAAHPMSPTSGSGANTAINDSAILAELMRREWDGETNTWREGGIQRVIQEYEEQMKVYAAEGLSQGFMGMKMILGIQKELAEFQPVVA